MRNSGLLLAAGDHGDRSDITLWVGSRLIDKGDIRNLALMCDSFHEHDSLAGVELTHGSSFCLNAESRMPKVYDSTRIKVRT